MGLNYHFRANSWLKTIFFAAFVVVRTMWYCSITIMIELFGPLEGKRKRKKIYKEREQIIILNLIIYFYMFFQIEECLDPLALTEYINPV